MTAPPPSAKPWEAAKGGEGSQLDPLAARFVESLSYDTRLYDADIRGSIAHARMLHRVSLVTERELADIERGLDEIRREIQSAPAGPNAVNTHGAWPGWKIELEDVHMCIEAALIAKVGDPGRKLHTGRSRNDQVALDLRLWLREACCSLVGRLDALRAAFERLAARQGDVLIPGYTHMQRAQPSCVGAEAMAWWSMFRRDEESLIRLAGDPLGLGSSPLGAGAIAGSTLPLDRAMTARDLGMAGGPALSSIDATASRDEAMDFLYALSRTGIHLSRFAEQWILYSTTEFGFLSIGAAYTTGSSMMPQKRNPDMLELIRGRAGNLIGSLVSLLTICKGLPIAYNRDLQEDKRHVFAAYDIASDCLDMAARIVESAMFDADRIRHAGGGIDRGYLDATVLAESLVSRGVPFRTAHQVVGSLVRLCDSTGRHELRQLQMPELAAALAQCGQTAAMVGPEVLETLGAQGVAQTYRTLGHAGTSPGGYRDWLAGIDRASSATPAPTSPSPPRSSNPITEHPVAQTAAPGLFGADPAPSGSARAAPPLDAATDALIASYVQAGRSLDDLPYTPEFERLYANCGGAGGEGRPGGSQRDVLRRLHNLRKAGRLPKLGRQAVQSAPPRISPEEERTLAGLVIDTTGTLGQRDQLPYDPQFEAIVNEFNQRTGRMMSPHDVWRLIAKLAK